MAFYIALSVVKAREHESEVKLYVLLSSLDCCSTKNDSLKKITAQHQIISSSLFFRVTDESQNMRIFACFIVCHAVAPFRAAKSSAGTTADFQAGGRFALGRS